MSREKVAWFGITLTKKQATNVFILSLAGIFLLSLILIPFIFSMISMLRYIIPYGGIEFIWNTLLYTLPYLIVLLIFLILCIYSLLRSRKIAMFHSEVITTQNSESRDLLFCPNCGNKRTALEKFCKICGEALV